MRQIGLVALVGCGKNDSALPYESETKANYGNLKREIVCAPPAIGSDGRVYVGSEDKKLYAIKTDSKGLAKSPWPMFRQNAQHTGRAPNK